LGGGGGGLRTLCIVTPHIFFPTPSFACIVVFKLSHHTLPIQFGFDIAFYYTTICD
jgi:hypothetical protein